MKPIAKNLFDIAIIGGGASGMMAAITSASYKKSVILIEKNQQLGRKILATGNGRCNLTNLLVSVERYHGGDPNFIKDVLEKFDQFRTIQFFEKLGLVLKEENLGRIFPRNDQASTVVNALVHELKTHEVEVKLNNQARRITKNGDFFEIGLLDGQKIKAKKIVLTTGGKSADHLGTSGDAYYWLENLGHTITKLYPSLAPLELKEPWIKEIQGLKVEAKVSTTIDGQTIYEKEGDALFTHFGLSGPAAMAQAGAIGPYLASKVPASNGKDHDIKIHLDLIPEIDLRSLDEKIANIINCSGAKQIKNILAGLIPSNLTPILLQVLKINPDKKGAEISKIDRQKIAQILKNTELSVTGVRPFRESQVTHGGVKLSEVNARTIESKIIPGLFFAGEILDVDGDSGGFNLQWAWSSGHLAGQMSSK